MRYIRKINGYVEESPIPPYRGAEYYAAHGYLRSDSTLPLSLRAIEKQHIARMLGHTGGNKTEAARLLGIGLTTLYRKIEEYGL